MFLFCPKCHARVQVPAALLNGNVKVAKHIKVKCGNNNGRCTGVILFKPKENENINRNTESESIVC